jgi:hypothetical protein
LAEPTTGWVILSKAKDLGFALLRTTDCRTTVGRPLLTATLCRPSCRSLDENSWPGVVSAALNSVKSRNYFALDERENALDYLRRTERFIAEAENDSLSWKWVAISLYGALYGFAIAASPQNLTWRMPGAGRTTLDQFIASRMTQKVIFPPECSRLVSVDWAISICLRQPGRRPTGGKPHELTQLQKKAIKQLLHVYRDNFTHFHTRRLVIPGNELPCLTSEVLDVIRLIAVDIGLIDHEMKDEVSSIVARSKRLLTQLQ